VTEPRQQPPPGGEPEPEVSGTVFLMALFLMATIGLWVIMYLKLIGR
jgi:hypothetical protein